MPAAAELRLGLAAEELRLGVVGCGDAGSSGFAAGEEEARRGCNAHIVRLPQNQQLTDFDPPGVDFLNCLIFNETNNVCVAPPALLAPASMGSPPQLPSAAALRSRPPQLPSAAALRSHPYRRSLRLLRTTEMELKAMAALAHMGFRSRPVTG